MTRDSRDRTESTDDVEFREELAALVEQATEAGVDVRGSWELSTREEGPNLEVEFVSLAKEMESED